MRKLFIYLFISIFIFSGCSSTNNEPQSEVSNPGTKINEEVTEIQNEVIEDEIISSEEMTLLKIDESQEIMVLFFSNY